MKRQQETELFRCVVTVNGEKTAKEIPTEAMAGTLRIERTGSLLAFGYRPDTSEAFLELLRVEQAPSGAATAAVSFRTPPKTASVVRLVDFSQRWSRDPESAFAPIYLSRGIVADRENNSVRLLVLEKGVREKGDTLRIAPGGLRFTASAAR